MSTCVPNFQCNNGKNTIIGVPWNASTYVLFYNKKLLAKAGIKRRRRPTHSSLQPARS